MNDSAPPRMAALDATEAQDWPLARTLWTTITTAQPRDGEAQLRLAEALYFAQQPAEASAIARLAARLVPRDARPLLIIARAETALDLSAQHAATAAWRAVLALAPQSFEAWARLSEQLMRQGRIGAALESLVQALSIQAGHPFGLALAAQVLTTLPPRQRHERLVQLVAAASPDGGLALLHVAAQLDPQDQHAQQALATALLARRAYGQAVAPLRALAQASPDAPKPLLELARALHRAQQWPEAARQWRRLLQRWPSQVEAGLAEAVRCLNEATAALPGGTAMAEPPGGDAREAAQAAMRQQDWPAAQLAWDQLLALLPADPEALLGAGRARFQQDHLAEARRSFARALRLAPGIEPLRWLARTLRSLREDREALALWQHLLQAAPGDLEAVLRVAEATAKLGDLLGALSTLDAGRRLLGNDPRIIRLQARLLGEAGSTAAALQHWTALADSLPRDAEARLQAGLTAQLLGDYILAERWLRAALHNPPVATRAAAALSRLLNGAGRPAEGRAVLRRALRQAPREPSLWQAGFAGLHAAGRLAVVDRTLAAQRRRAGNDPAARLTLAGRLLDAEHLTAAHALLQALLEEPTVAVAAADLLVRSALRLGDAATATAVASKVAGLPVATRHEVALASRFAARLHAEAAEPEPHSGYWSMLAQAARRRGYPRYLPQPMAVVHLLARPMDGPAAGACMAQITVESSAYSVVTLLRPEAGSAHDALASAGATTACLADHALAAPAALAALPDLAVPAGLFGEALRPRQVGLLVAALGALRPAVLVVWSPSLMADAALAALALGIPALVLRLREAAPDQRPLLTEADRQLRQRWRLALRTALLHGDTRLQPDDDAILAGWLAWLGLPEAAVLRHDDAATP